MLRALWTTRAAQRGRRNPACRHVPKAAIRWFRGTEGRVGLWGDRRGHPKAAAAARPPGGWAESPTWPPAASRQLGQPKAARAGQLATAPPIEGLAYDLGSKKSTNLGPRAWLRWHFFLRKALFMIRLTRHGTRPAPPVGLTKTGPTSMVPPSHRPGGNGQSRPDAP